MLRSSGVVVVISASGLLFAVSGCSDELKTKNAHIALIEDTNQQLTADLAFARREADELVRDRDEWRSRLEACQRDTDELAARLASKPEPPPIEGWQAVPGGAMIAIEGNVLFASGKPTLRTKGRTALDAISSAIRSRYPEKDIFVFGHTDDAPIKKSGWKDNFELSTQRALTVVRYLKDHGIGPTRLVACGAGKHRPLVTNSSHENRARNRRVEIFAVDPKDPVGPS